MSWIGGRLSEHLITLAGMSDPARAQVLQLAPDAASTAAAERLARSGSWLDLGGSARGLWGLCQGSAATPYETVVALEGSVGACTCPSRKRPCKHVLALLLLWVDDGIGVREEPDFVVRWFERQAAAAARAGERARGLTERGGGLADPEAAVKRAEQRRARVDLGLAELDRWLGDQVRTGLAALPRAGYAHFDAVAARMVDAQAPGVASTLRSIPGELVGADWPQRALHALGGLRLLIAAHTRLDQLPDDLAATVRSRVGYPTSKDDVFRGPAVGDRWHALAAVDTIDDQLETRRVWLLGERTGRWAMWLTFAAPGQSLDTSVRQGQVIDGDLHFYPGSGQYRALVGVGHCTEPMPFPPAGSQLDEVREQFAEVLAADPWAGRMPALVCGVPLPPGEPGEPWQWRDAAGETVSLEPTALDPWTVLAHSCGDEVTVFGEWHGTSLAPLAVVAPCAAVAA